MRNVCLLMVLVIFSSVFAAEHVTVTNEKIELRKQQAVEIVSSDEGFLSEYYEKLTRHTIEYFFQLAFKMAEEVAERTVYIISDEEAYYVMLCDIEHREGVKYQVERRVVLYLKGEYQCNEIEVVWKTPLKEDVGENN